MWRSRAIFRFLLILLYSAALSLPKSWNFRSWAFRWCFTHKADKTDVIYCVLRSFFGVPPAQMTAYEQKFGMETLMVHKWQKCWFSTNKFSKLPLRISCLIITVMEVQIVLYDNFGNQRFSVEIPLENTKNGTVRSTSNHCKMNRCFDSIFSCL